MAEISEKDFNDLKQTVDKIYYAVVGNELLKDGGMIGQLGVIVVRIDKHEERLDALEKKNIKLSIYQKIMWGGLGTAAGVLFAFLLEVFSKK
jgi:hypothetical protein